MNHIRLRLLLCDLRGAGNVGSILRTADATGVELVYACGYTPYPAIPGDDRPPHVITSNSRAIGKTSLGAESSVSVRHFADVEQAIAEAKRDGFDIIVLEQSEKSLNLFSFVPQTGRLALIFGNEVTGVAPAVLGLATHIIEIPMSGQKESLGVAVAAAIAMYQLRHVDIS